MKKTALITGANRGIGLGFVKQLQDADYRVFAGCRYPDGAEALHKTIEEKYILPLDVNEADSIANAGQLIRKNTKHLDLLINNAGIGVEKDNEISRVGYESMVGTFITNTVGPLLVTEQFHGMMNKGGIIANISSLMGSIADNQSGGYYSYRISKAGLNMASKNMALELSDRGIIVLNLHPGWVQTDMGGTNAAITVEESVSGMHKVIQKARPGDSGRYYDFRGRELPW